MAERRATNKYYPPDWDPSQGSVNAYIGQHPLRDRARKLNEGILIVRFELPFSIWCGGCNSLLSTGLRFNAEKKKIGSYYTTPVWSFRLKCRECGHWFEIHTNPKDSAYEVVSGARKRAMPEMSNEDDGTAGEIVDLSRVEDSDNKNSLLHKLEALDARKQRDKRTMERLSMLQTASDNQWKDSDKTNAHLRRVFRAGRKEREEHQRQSDEIRSRTGIGVPILPSMASDSLHASYIQFGRDDNPRERKRIASEAIGRPLFGNTYKKPTGLKAKLALQHLSKTDPFASLPSCRAAPLPDLGIKKTKSQDVPMDSLAEFSQAYAELTSSSSSDDEQLN